MRCVKRSITLSVPLNSYVETRAKKLAKQRGQSTANFSAALSDIVVEARELETKNGKGEK